MNNIYLIIGLALIVIFTGWTLNLTLTAIINFMKKHTLFTDKYMDFYSFLHRVLMDNEIICSMDYANRGYMGSYDAEAKTINLSRGMQKLNIPSIVILLREVGHALQDKNNSNIIANKQLITFISDICNIVFIILALFSQSIGVSILYLLIYIMLKITTMIGEIDASQKAIAILTEYTQSPTMLKEARIILACCYIKYFLDSFLHITTTFVMPFRSVKDNNKILNSKHILF